MRRRGLACLPDSPDTHGDQRDADQTLAVGGDRVERQLLAHQQQQRGDQENAGGVTRAPLEAERKPFDPKPARVTGRGLAQDKRRDRGEMIRARENV